MKLYLDDERSTPDGWVRVYNVPTLIHLFSNNSHLVTHISLDNDLGCGEPEGWEFMDWLEEQVHEDINFPVPEMTFHTSNPVARSKMKLILKSILRKKAESK